METRTIKSNYEEWHFNTTDGSRVSFTTQLTGTFKINGSDVTGKISKRYWSKNDSEDTNSFTFGTPSQVVALLKKNKVANRTTDDIKRNEDYWLESRISDIKKELVNERKEKFMGELKDLLKKYDFTMNVECDVYGWGEASASATVSLQDKLFGLSSEIVDLVDNENETIE